MRPLPQLPCRICPAVPAACHRHTPPLNSPRAADLDAVSQVSREGSYLTRHPSLAAHDRLLRLELELEEPGWLVDARGSGRLEEQRSRGPREALAELLGRGFVFAGRLYK